jgi:Tfp pilus assembly protein PilX
MKPPVRQRGAVLVVSLIFLVLITLFVVCSIKMSSADLRVVGNIQNKMAMTQSAQQAIEQQISTIASFDAPAPQTVNVNNTPVAVRAPVCLGTSPAPGYTAVANVTLYDTAWSVTATAADPSSGATATVTQGVRIRLPTNYCP